MSKERDKFLTEAIAASVHWICTCRNNHPLGCYLHPKESIEFSEWVGFGHLVEWSRVQGWWEDFCAKHDPLKTFGCWEALIDPDRFADAVFEYLKPCCEHEWGTDGLHSNIFCKKCFKSQKQINK